MKRIVSLVVGFFTITQGAFALNTNRSDVRSAEGAVERLTTGERIRIKSSILLAEMLRFEFLVAQAPMNYLGLKHKTSFATVALGAAQIYSILTLSEMAEGAVDRIHFGEVDRRLTRLLAEHRGDQHWIQAVNSEISRLRSMSSPHGSFGDAIHELEKILAARQTKQEGVQMAIDEARAAASGLRRIGVLTRFALGGVAIPLVLYGTAVSSYSVILPEAGDRIIEFLNSYIDQANATLARQD